MITLRDVEQKLAAVGIYNKFWGRPEVKELRQILTPDEQIIAAVNGSYEHGFALLVATDHRVLLIDKKPLFLSLEDLRYDMISEVNYSTGVLTATLTILSASKKLQFKSVRLRKLRILTAYVQQHVMEIRQVGQNERTADVQQIPVVATPQILQTQREATAQVTPAVSHNPIPWPQAISDLGIMATNFSLRQRLNTLSNRPTTAFQMPHLTTQRKTPTTTIYR